MQAYSLTVLGTDFIGLSLAQTFVQEHDPEEIAVVGSPASDDQVKTLEHLFNSSDDSVDLTRFPEAFQGDQDVRTMIQKTNESLASQAGFFGGQLVDLELNGDGVTLLVRTQEGLSNLHTRYVIATAPPVLDVVSNGANLPGVDSTPAGLIIDRTNLSLNSSTDYVTFGATDDELIWDVDFGFETLENGTTSNMKFFICGQLGSGPTSTETLSGLASGFDSLPEPTSHFSRSFETDEWEDADLPEGFVDTKTETLRSLMSQVIDSSGNRDQLIQKLEGVAGEIDSYSRFRSDPDLQRLRWKTLTAMNYAQVFLSTDSKVSA
ncbi:MAG: hypothetical protein ABEK50_10150 [bacterium]